MARPKKEEFSEVKPTFTNQIDTQPKMIVPEVKPRQNPLIHKAINRKPVNLDSIEAMTPETDHMVTGTFVNIEYPGQTAKVSGKYYKGMEYFSRLFNDGERCSIPHSVARYISERICHDQHNYILDSNGNPTKSTRSISRYKFIIEQHHQSKYAEAA